MVQSHYYQHFQWHVDQLKQAAKVKGVFEVMNMISSKQPGKEKESEQVGHEKNVPAVVEVNPLEPEVVGGDDWLETQQQYTKAAIYELAQALREVLANSPDGAGEKVSSIKIGGSPKAFIVTEFWVEANLK